MSIEDYLNKHSTRLRKIAEYTGNSFHLDVDEVYQQASIKIYKHYSTRDIKSSNEFISMFTVVCKNLCIDLNRKNSAVDIIDLKEYGVDKVVLNAFEDPTTHSNKESDYLDLISCIADDLIREVMILRDIEGFLYEDIATKLGVSYTTVIQRYKRGLNKIRENMGLTSCEDCGKYYKKVHNCKK